MVVGTRLREIRTKKNLSRSELADRAGVSLSYVSRLENGHLLPAIEALEKLARALDTPLYLFFCDDKVPLNSLVQTESSDQHTEPNGLSKWEHMVEQFRALLGDLLDEDRKLLLHVAARMGRKRKA
jgi:transcriptional regulator with XRE-family HTH domain